MQLYFKTTWHYQPSPRLERRGEESGSGKAAEGGRGGGLGLGVERWGGDHQPTLPSHSNRSCLLSRTLMLTFYIGTARDLACLLHCNDFINKQTIVSIDSTDALFIQMFFGFVQFIG